MDKFIHNLAMAKIKFFHVLKDQRAARARARALLASGALGL